MGRFREDDGDEPCSLGDGECIHETDRAILVVLDDNKGEEVWIPKSVLECSDVNETGDKGDVSVKTWWARKNGHA